MRPPFWLGRVAASLATLAFQPWQVVALSLSSKAAWLLTTISRRDECATSRCRAIYCYVFVANSSNSTSTHYAAFELRTPTVDTSADRQAFCTGPPSDRAIQNHTSRRAYKAEAVNRVLVCTRRARRDRASARSRRDDVGIRRK